MKLDVNVLRYLSKEEFRVLTAVEMGQKNVSIQCRILRAADASRPLPRSRPELEAAGLGAAAGPAQEACRRRRADAAPNPPTPSRPAQHELVPAPLVDSISGLK
jgi:hypothetical protein